MKHFPVVVIPLYIWFVYYFLFTFHHMLGQTLMSTSYHWVLQEPTALEVRSLCGNSPLGSVGLSRVVSESSLNVSSFPHALNCFFRVGAIPWHLAVLTFIMTLHSCAGQRRLLPLRRLPILSPCLSSTSLWSARPLVLQSLASLDTLTPG